MSTLEKIADLRIVDHHPGYDKVNNPLLLSVAELAPVGLTWQSGGVQHAIRSQAGVSGRLLGDASGIAVVEGPYDPSANRAYIVNADGSSRARIPAQIGAERVMFYTWSKLTAQSHFWLRRLDETFVSKCERQTVPWCKSQEVGKCMSTR
ncbi:hypothetical protein B0G75_102404 [Paraburkholderia sp. BL18I3N2]|nr:hypothetical protein B0G75_102404 [Paraburkholderia sp. BL18I3N2]